MFKICTPLDITPRQQEVLEGICDISFRVKRPPTYRQIMNYFGFKSSACVRHHLIALRNAGLVNWVEVDGKAVRRTLQVNLSEVL